MFRLIIDESGLVRAIKAAYKRGGYAILNHGEQVTIYTEGWYVRCDWDKFPRKALSAIVEQTGMIPAGDNAYSVEKGQDLQTVIPEIVGEDMDHWLNGNSEERVTMVEVMFKGLQVYQLDSGGSCFGVNPGSLGIVDQTIAECKDAAVIDENRLAWKHDGEMVIILAHRPTAAYWAKEWERDIWAALESVDLHRQPE